MVTSLSGVLYARATAVRLSLAPLSRMGPRTVRVISEARMA